MRSQEISEDQMKGCQHTTFATDQGLHLYNGDDEHYTQIFESPAEVEAFADSLLAAASERWPGQVKSNIPLMSIPGGVWRFDKDLGCYIQVAPDPA
jgi:hypothetical protein